MAYNYKIGQLKPAAVYRVSLIDKWDGSSEVKEMDGATLASFTNAAAHLYDIHAEELPEEPEEIQEVNKMYNYHNAVKEDIREYIADNYTVEELKDLLLDADDFGTRLHDDMWIADSVTGNASGSYTFSTWKAEEYLCHNLDLLSEAAQEFGGDIDILKNGAEHCDVTIRCYLLGQIIPEVLEELQEEHGVNVPF